MVNFNERLKLFRKQNDMTQEQVAEYIGVSPQAVSRWECGITCPDISQLPLLAYVFNVTTDTLLGVDMQKTNERISELLQNAQTFTHQGDFKGSVQILKEGLKDFPKSYQIMTALAESLSCVDLDSYANIINESSVSYKNITDEIVALCRKVISECTDQTIRDKAFQTLIFRYKNAGQKEKAADYAKMMSHIWASQEDMMISIYENDADMDTLHDYISFCTDRLMTCIDILSTKDEFSFEDKEKLLHQIIDIGNTVFCDGDWNYYAHHLISAYQTLAEEYSIRQEKEKALESLEKLCCASILFDTYEDDAKNTSPAVRGDRHGRPIPWDENSCARLVRCLNEEKWYDFIRMEPRFTAVLRELQNKATPCK